MTLFLSFAKSASEKEMTAYRITMSQRSKYSRSEARETQNLEVDTRFFILRRKSESIAIHHICYAIL